MAHDDDSFLNRWGRRKRESANAAPATAPGPAQPLPALPPIDGLSFDSDFEAFMHAKVDERVRRMALKKLFSDPRFNVMDGLDIYIGDYTQSDPMPEGMLAKIADVYNKLAEEGAAKPEAEAAAEGGASVAAAEESAPPAPPHEESPSDAAAEEDHDRRG